MNGSPPRLNVVRWRSGWDGKPEGMTTASSMTARRIMLNKVREVTVYF